MAPTVATTAGSTDAPTIAPTVPTAALTTAPTAAPTALTQDFDVHLEGGDYPDEVSWRFGEGGTTYAAPLGQGEYYYYYAREKNPQTISLPPGENMLYMIDSYGDGWNGASWTLKAAGGETVVAGLYTFSSGFSATQVFTAWTTPTSVPTATPTNAGDTNAPTSSPTATPTASPTNVGDTNMPTASLTAAPTATPPASNWNQLSNKCGTSACNTANGGCTIVLGDDFVMGSYNGEISFSGKTISIWGQGTVLDASGGGRFFTGNGFDSLLELHEVVLQNAQSDSVSGRVLVVATVFKLF
jgi:hypothetical protein